MFASDGRIDFELLPTANGVVTKDFGYDAQGRVGSLHHFVDSPSAPNRSYDDGETRLDAFVYAYAKDGSRTGEVWTDRGGLETTRRWTYDGLNRLTKEVYDGRDTAGNALSYTDRFAFDLSSNRISLDHDDRTTSGTGSAGPDAITIRSAPAPPSLVTNQNRLTAAQAI